MGDRGGNRGRGQGRGRGRGSSQNQGNVNADAIKFAERARNLERAAKDVQQLLEGISIGGGKDESASAQKSASKKTQGNRGSKSMTNLNPKEKDQGKKNQSGPQKEFKHEKGGKGPGGGDRGKSSQQHKESRSQPPSHKNYRNPQSSGGQSGYKPHGQPFHQGPRHPQHQSQNQNVSHPYHPSSIQRPATSFHQSHGSQGSGHCSTQYEHQSWSDGRQGYRFPPPSYDESNRHLHQQVGMCPTPPPMNFNLNPEPQFVNPPPPYVATQRPEPRYSEEKQPQMEDKAKLTAEDLVKALAVFDGQWGTGDSLSRHVQRSVEEVNEVVKSRSDIFSHMVDGNEIIIELVPKVNLCSDYLSESSCVSRDSCKDLHLCKFFITGSCKHGSSCQFGHRLDTNHNSSVLSKLYLDLISKHVLYNVIKKVFRGNVSPQICKFYNGKKGCLKKEKCGSLHICEEYVRGVGKCSNTGCSLNHDIFTEHCKRHLRRCGISLNESPRDILLNLKSSLQNQDDDDESTDVSSSQKSRKSKGKEEDAEKLNTKRDLSHDSRKKLPSETESDSDSSEQGDTGGEKESKKKNKGKDKEKSGKKTKTTCRSTDVCGDVEIPEICIYAVNDKCLNEKKGCRYLHAKSLFHWQVEKDNNWYNFRVFHSKALEKAYRDVTMGSVQLAPLDPETLDTREKDMLKVLGKELWTVDFRNMQIKGASESKILKIRRISTRSAAVFDNPKATVYDWYYNDEQGKWICFGQIDSLGKQELACPITCEEIEKQYLSDPSSSMVISNVHFKYKLNFKDMTQTNLETSKVTEIRRRPTGLSYQKKSAASSDNTSNPAYWTPMTPSQTHVLVPLDPSKTEFQEVSSRLRLTNPTAIIQKIQRLQNPYLWCLLQQKKASLSLRYDEHQMNMQKLFHGINPVNVDTMCKENIDWRQDTSTNQDFGKGTYFSNSAAVARSHCVADDRGHFSMILADVIVGSMALGAPTLTRPPVNISTNSPFDTTVDDVHAPTIFVKYDKEDYYPEYFIEFY